ncbi:SapC family protein [Hirschia litorea]|uniref:SapC family protein n=1 Tax=Hirschia litorea TaxID=1199156 RepID=A0ABW2IPD1_9PROT
MTKLTPLDAARHKDLKVTQQRAQMFAAGRHMIALNVAELSRAIVDFPVLISRVTGQGGFSLSALTSFEPGKNLYLDDDGWQSSFTPSQMHTFPFALMANDSDPQNPHFAIDESFPAFSKAEGQPLMDASGQPALWLSPIKAQLIENMKNAQLTDAFFQALVQHELISSLVISVQYSDGQTNKIGGLSSINEDRFKSLSTEALADLNGRGFLGPIYALLFSIFQLNGLIRKNNASKRFSPISKISLELAKDIQTF